MTVSTGAYLASAYAQAKALGDKSVSSDAMLVIDGYEHMRLLFKQFPWPILSPAGEIEVPGQNGSASWQKQQLKPNLQGQVTAYETEKGHLQAFIEAMNASGGGFASATVYEGSMESYSRGVKIVDGFFQFDSPDRDWENRAQVTTVSGTMFYHFFGESIPGNR
jgi:hypothetical protein